MRVLSLLFLAGLLVGCSDREDFTRGELAEAIFTPWCERGVECFPEDNVTVTECVNLVLTGICSSENCSEDVSVSGSDLDECIADMGELTCSEFDSGVFPASCVSLDID